MVLDAVAGRKISLLTAARENCAHQYEDASRTFNSLDSKAQWCATLAGVQLAALVVFLREENARALYSVFGNGGVALLGVALVLLLAVIAASVVAMKVTAVPVPYQAAEEVEAVASLLELEDAELTDQVLVNHLAEHNAAWKEAVDGISSAIESKAQSVSACQWLLLVALASSSGVVYLLLLSAWHWG